ncbi:GNAT family N-acetyltransferase [Acinetobacter gerneri]|jgi:putative acetyltransferase|uniref:GNAT family N-acetyltransferase n=1 Tax=Acinetobacter gerneri TaxID=202952 RepID=UPI0023F0C486|nr:N-acetyltransferase [Acinetobacter gerneri]MCH4245984.1 N-acetyltransferase [Acinetobacter gerneri]
MDIVIRHEQKSDIGAIFALTERAFSTMSYSSHTEQFIVNALRDTGKLSISLVALEGDQLVGHIAVSPVQLSNAELGWYAGGPLSVLPEKQNMKIGTKLVFVAIEQLKKMQAKGCVLVGDPNYYQRFGFKPSSDLIYPDLPAEYFQVLAFNEVIPKATVQFDPAFLATA